MNDFSSKICPNCCSVQEPRARFCDNCGQLFAAAVTSAGAVTAATKYSFRRQVAETRPLFWACITVVSMLAVFGFTQSGLFRGKEDVGKTPAPAAQMPAQLVSPADPAPQPANVAGPAVGSQTSGAANDAFNLNFNDSAFVTPHEPSPLATARKRPFTVVVVKPAPAPDPELAKADPAPVAVQKPIESPPAPAADVATKKSEPVTPTAPRVYVRGPMGGCYYISASGSKRYVDRNLCS